MSETIHTDLPSNTLKPSNDPTLSPIVPTFFRYVVPSVLSLLAISTASIVDGFFVGNFLGTKALASVNLLIPYLSLLFGVALMLAVGGSVKAGLYIGQNKCDQASDIFNKALACVFVLTIFSVPLSLFFKENLFASLGASPELYPLMGDYFVILTFAMVVQLLGLVLYYFIRADNYPELGMRALLIGSACNIILNGVFIGIFKWGIQGAALATLLSQCVQLSVMLFYFTKKERHLHLAWPKGKWSELIKSSLNGFSEFINEISVGIVILVLHWIISRQSGTEGIAAFSVINYLIFISLMVYYGIVDAMHGLLSQNFGAGKAGRVTAFMQLSILAIAVLSMTLVLALHLFQENIIEFFLEEGANNAKLLAANLIHIIWPLFLFNGFNVLVCAYLTSAEKALPSSTLALFRSLILPISFALILSLSLSGLNFMYALPLAESITFIFACIFMVKFRPSRLIPYTAH